MENDGYWCTCDKQVDRAATFVIADVCECFTPHVTRLYLIELHSFQLIANYLDPSESFGLFRTQR